MLLDTPSTMIAKTVTAEQTLYVVMDGEGFGDGATRKVDTLHDAALLQLRGCRDSLSARVPRKVPRDVHESGTVNQCFD